MVKFTDFHFTAIKEWFCNHEFVLDEHHECKRTCKKCKRHEWIIAMHDYEWIWKRMPFGERK